MYIYGGSVSLTNSTISGNVGDGYFSYYGGSFTAANSTISNNTSFGIDSYGRVSLTNSTVSNNGGEGVNGNFVTVVGSTISGNGGDGVYAFLYQFATLTNSIISGNAGRGVGCSDCLDVRLTNTTVTGNGGGGVYFDTYNQQSTVSLTRTVISVNTGAPGGAQVFNDGGSITAASFNLFGYRGLTNDEAFENFTPGQTDITATSNGNDPTRLDRILNPTLANNGGPTRTHALVGGSPAIDTITDGTCPPPARDQRGVRRPQDGDHDGAPIYDTGSFERR
ncbi:MAG TPA: right-handed parallel beta-helix repeat-containing protein [Gammaproteobacteria bacterium]|nr:right-handed parallel beta-helix repeat-containing protein [Gammaproteobacteria bacterium]